MPEKLIVLDPTLEVQVAHSERAPRPPQLHTLGLVDNGKPNSDKLLRQVAALLSEQYPAIEIKYYRKPGAYRPAPVALLDQVAAECDTVLVGIGD
ncbi:MAG TPA: hypothetical protein VKR06_38700 [Ktedonosporobacter sp.]|nr:hypothetical protein [Ktedonosporobacter sp.]